MSENIKNQQWIDQIANLIEDIHDSQETEERQEAMDLLELVIDQLRQDESINFSNFE